MYMIIPHPQRATGKKRYRHNGLREMAVVTGDDGSESSVNLSGAGSILGNKDLFKISIISQ